MRTRTVVSESGCRYKPLNNAENQIIADWLLRLTQPHKRWEFGLYYLCLGNTKDFCWNHKRVYRIYRELELNVRITPRRRLKRDRPDPLGEATTINQVWPMDFMSDFLASDRSLRIFNVIDDYNQEALCIDVDL